MILDIVIISVLLISAVVSFFRGFIKEIMTILGLGGAALGTFLFGGAFREPLEGWLVHSDDKNYEYFGIIPDEYFALILSYVAVFILIFIVMAILSHFISKGAQAIGLGPVDRSLGAVFGILRGFVLVAIVYLSFSLVMSPEDFPDWVMESRFIPVVDTATDWVVDHTDIERPINDLETGVEDLEEKMDTMDRVRGEYIDDRGETGAKNAPGENAPGENAPGYEKQDRNAMDRLIENDAFND